MRCVPSISFVLLVLCLGPITLTPGANAGPCRVREQSRAGTVICNITSEVDFPRPRKSTLQFRLMKLTQYFRIDQRSGVLRVKNPIDREVVCPQIDAHRRIRCTLDARVAVFTNPDQPKFFPVQIEIEDINDHSPEFPRSKIIEAVREDVPVGHVMTLLKASDPDAGVAGEVKYTLEGEDKASFALDASGVGGDELKLKSLTPFDRETRASYHLMVMARDGGSPPRSGSLSVVIQVTDVNDHKPVFVNLDSNIEVAEHDPKYVFREHQISSLEATDKDENSHVTFDLGKSADPAIGRIFSVTPQGGLVLNRPLNYDTRREYRVPVVAIDSGKPPAATTATVTVRVTDVNNNAPEIEFQTWKGSRLEVMENKPPLTFVATITVRDRDQGINGDVTCRLDSDSDFTLDPLSTDAREREYKLLTRVSFDREESAERDFVITCEDHGAPERRSSTKRVLVYINDENDNGPMFYHSTLPAYIWENEPAGTEVLKVTAKDPDLDSNARVVYKLRSGYEGMFTIDSKTGRVHIKGPLDRETNQTVVFEVIAFDAKDHTKNATAKVVVHVKDRNDCSPVFDQNYTFTVRENEVGTQVGTVKATDGDFGKNGKIRYHLQATEKLHYWRLTDDGHLFVANKLDREEQYEYSLVVVARDGGTPARSASALIHIIVQDKNDHAPVFQFPTQANSTVNISADTKPGRVVTRVTATDIDSGENGRVEYALSRKLSHNHLFEINPQTGDIFLTKPIPSQVDRVFKLVVTASDHGEPRRTGYKVLSIRFRGGRRGRKGKHNVRTTIHESESPITREVLITFGIGLAVILMVVLAALVLYFCHQTQGRQRRRNRNTNHGSANGQSVAGKSALLRVCPCLKGRPKTMKEQPLYEEGVLTPMKKDSAHQSPQAHVPVFQDGTVKGTNEYDTSCYTKIDPNVPNDATSIYPYGQLAESELAGYSLYAPGNTHVLGSQGTMKPSETSPTGRGKIHDNRFQTLGSLDCLDAPKDVESGKGAEMGRDEKPTNVHPPGLEPGVVAGTLRKGRNNAGYSVRSPYLASSFV